MGDRRGGKKGRPRPPAEETLELERQVLELRRAGVDWDTISSRLETPRSTCRSAYGRALTRTLIEPADDVRALEVDRLDRIQAAVWARAMRGELPAVDRVIRVLERRAEMLGLDHKHGMAERVVELQEGQAQLVVSAFLAGLGAIGGLAPGDRDAALRAFLTGLGKGPDLELEQDEAARRMLRGGTEKSR